MPSIGLVEQWWTWVTAISWQLALLIPLIALISRGLPQRSAQLRHALWLLVLLKVFLPPGLTAPWSLGQWAVRPAVNSLSRNSIDEIGPGDAAHSRPMELPAADGDSLIPMVRPLTARPDFKRIAFFIWITGVAGLAMLIAVQWVRLQARLRSAVVVDEGPLRVALEQTAMGLGLSKAPELLLAESIPSPFLVGVLRPRIVLPARMGGMTPLELSPIFAHELAHWKRYDAWIGCLQVAVQVLLWFHPLVWWANSQLRQERECACDDEVLQTTALTPAEYGESLMQCLMTSRGERLAAGHVLGVLEQGTNLQTRMEQIMAHPKTRRSFGITSSVVVAGCAILLLPMALHPPITGGVAVAAEPAQGAKYPYPLVTLTSPKNGDLDVDPGLETVTVTFDRDMMKGMSWTGEIPVDKSRKPNWQDERTCELPVKLEKGKAYRIGINAPSFKNFASKGGEPTPPSAIYFATKGASANVKLQATLPKIVSIEPANGASDVDPVIKELKVTFDIAMGDGMSWAGGGDQFPTVPEGQNGQWSKDKKTCTLPVVLKPGHEYSLGVNAPKFQNFKSEAGVPLEPVHYTFSTRKVAGDSTEEPAAPSTASSAPLKAAPLDLDAAAAELKSKYGKAHPEVQEFVQQTMRSFGRSGMWLNERAYSKSKPQDREARVAYLAKLFEESDYGRHLCSGLAEASALKDPKLLPGLKKVAGYHVDGKDYDCRAKWMAVAALARQESPDAVPVLVSLVDHGNQNTRFWARAALSRMAKDDFKDDKQAWNKWWVDAGHEAIDPALLKPYVPPMPK